MLCTSALVGAVPIAPRYHVQASATLACKMPDEYIGELVKAPRDDVRDARRQAGGSGERCTGRGRVVTSPPVALPAVRVAVPVRVAPGAVASVAPLLADSHAPISHDPDRVNPLMSFAAYVASVVPALISDDPDFNRKSCDPLVTDSNASAIATVDHPAAVRLVAQLVTL